MKKLLLLAALCCSFPLFAQWGRPTPADTLHSTVVMPDGRVIFQVYAPKARTVSVTGGTCIALGGICEVPSGEKDCNMAAATSIDFVAGEFEIKNSSGARLMTMACVI